MCSARRVIPGAAIVDFDAALTSAGLAQELVTYPDAPHSFFDRSFDEWREACDDAWRRALGFIFTGDPRTRPAHG